MGIHLTYFLCFSHLYIKNSVFLIR